MATNEEKKLTQGTNTQNQQNAATNSQGAAAAPYTPSEAVTQAQQLLQQQQANKPGTDPKETKEPTDGDTVVINGVSYTRDQIQAAQKYLNIPVTGEWDSASVSAAKKKGYGHLGAVMDAMQEHDGDHTLDYLQSNGSIYDQLLGAVSTSKGLYSKNNPDERQAAYKEALDIVNEAYKNGLITAEQRASLLRVATPASR